MKDLKFKVESPEHSEVLINRLVELGFSDDSKQNLIGREFLFIGINNTIDWCSKFLFTTSSANYTETTLNDLYNKDFLRDNLGIGKEEEKSLPELNGHQVELTDKGIKVGCTEVTHSQLKVISKASKANQRKLNPKPKKVYGVYNVGDIVVPLRDSRDNPILNTKIIQGEPFIIMSLSDILACNSRRESSGIHQNSIRHATKKEIKQFKKSQNA